VITLDHGHAVRGRRGCPLPGTGSTLLGWNAVSPTATRPVCLGAVEHSVYVHPDAQGQCDAAFLNALIISTEAAGIWTIRSGIFPENTARLALHHRAGFRTIGVRVRIGRHHGGWRGSSSSNAAARQRSTLWPAPGIDHSVKDRR
jgi:L-amino acid N-acyltransferase YncA